MIQSPKGMSIMEAYELYRKGMLIVNRRYQRKLVWATQEKQNLVDSIFKKYPVPLILLASIGDGKYEIIDGMQRLNAFFSFIENQFSIKKDDNNNNYYFNVKDYTFAQSQADKKVFSPVILNGINHELFISQEEVSSFISYQFPVTIFESDSDNDINETFMRINANGRHLSSQEVRQAGNTTQFSSLIREVASEIRGDISPDILLLSEMPAISIDSRASSGQGINAEDIFWCSHGILRTSDVRSSEDEQFIADIVLSVILDQPFPASKKEFDNYYGSGDVDKSSEAEIRINGRGKDRIKEDINRVFSEIFNFNDSIKPGKLNNILNPKASGNPVKEAFYTLYMAFYELIINQNKMPFDLEGIKKVIFDLHKKLDKKSNHITAESRKNSINLTEGLIKSYFKDAGKTFRSPTSFIIDFQAYLTKSKVESAAYDYKQGLYTLDPKGRKLEEHIFNENILKNIAALSNLGKNRKGYLFLGVSDKEADTLQIEKLDSLSNLPRYNGFGIVGLEREAKLKGVTLDNYISFIIKKISDSGLPNELKVRLTRSITPITYYNYTVLMIEVESGSEPVFYNDKLYYRDGASCVEITGAKQADIFKLFK